MNDLQFLKKSLVKSSNKLMIIGAFIFGFGLLFIWIAVAGLDKQMKNMTTGGLIVSAIMLVVFIGVGGLMVILGWLDRTKIANGNHPLIEAIENKKKDFVTWIYIMEVQGQVAVYSQTLFIHYNTGKHKTIMGSVQRIKGLLEYLHQEFPDADLGYSQELLERHVKSRRR